MKTALINATVYDFNSFHQDSFVLFDKKIIEIGEMKNFINQDYRIVDCKDHLVMPSFVLGHTHIYSAFARGMQVPFSPKHFYDILKQLWWKMDKSINNEMTYYSGIVAAVDLMKHGITTIIDHHASGVDIIGSLDALHQAVTMDVGLRGCFAFETSDRFSIDACIQENRQFILNHQTGFARGMFGLHASLSLSDKTLRMVKRVLGKTPIHIHVAESKMDQDDAIKKYQKRVIHRLDDFNLLNEFSILAHCIHVDDSELDIIKKRKCHIALNVTSNMNNGVGLPDYHAIKAKGIPMIMGNDGISSSITLEYMYLYYAMHLQDASPTRFGFDDLIAIINQTYAYASGLFDVSLGRILPDYEADISIMPYIPPTPLNENNVFSHLFFGLFDSFKPRHVFVQGRQVVNNFRIPYFLEEKYRLAHNYAQALWQDILTKEK